ncbi:unnamed protein product [Paramecium sonneborni]|uniref:Uncharacterized protein n=1 Tax=Paramecium sonneborni TaxID=65129 RepID=A0A8S1QDU6_9CILI|nr:unnamed protein product [Paramecium sonneborni]
MQKVILKTKIFSGILILLSVKIAVLALILARETSDIEIKIYGTLFGITAFLFMSINFYVFYLLQTINVMNAEINNINCFSSWIMLHKSILNNTDFWFSKYLLKCLIIIIFYYSLQFRYVAFAVPKIIIISLEYTILFVFFIISLFIGSIMQLYLLIQLMIMLVDFKEYSKNIVYIYHIKDSLQEEQSYKRKITLISIIFTLGSIGYYGLKLALYILIVKNNDIEINNKVYSIIVSILNVSCIMLSLQIFRELKIIYQRISNTSDVIIYNLNIHCFTGWFILIKSLIFSKKFRFWRIFIFILLYIQTIYGLIIFPYHQINNISIKQMYCLESYLYYDTAILVVLIFTQLIESFARIIHQVKKKNLEYQLEDHRACEQINYSKLQICQLQYQNKQMKLEQSKINLILKIQQKMHKKIMENVAFVLIKLLKGKECINQNVIPLMFSIITVYQYG